MTDQEKLRQAATLIEQVVAGLDLSQHDCSAGHKHFTNPAHARVFERLKGTPDKLKTAATQLTSNLSAVAAPCERTSR